MNETRENGLKLFADGNVRRVGDDRGDADPRQYRGQLRSVDDLRRRRRCGRVRLRDHRRRKARAISFPTAFVSSKSDAISWGGRPVANHRPLTPAGSYTGVSGA